MKVRRVILALIIATVCIVSLMTCKRLIYYLSQVYKVHGTVTVAGTDPPTPLGSVEVFVADFQYSELTNYYGDYEIEMAEGTWTLDFIKDGYEVASVEVTVSAETPRVEVNVALVPEPPEIAGEWRIDGPVLYYLDPYTVPPETATNILHQTIILYPDLSFEMAGTSQFDGQPTPVEQEGSGTYAVNKEAGTLVLVYTEFWYGGEYMELAPMNLYYEIEGVVLTLTWAEPLPYSPAEPMVYTRQ